MGKIHLSYEIVKETGPSHQKNFDVEVSLNGQVIGHGSGSSKKMAEQAAAKEALDKVEKQK